MIRHARCKHPDPRGPNDRSVLATQQGSISWIDTAELEAAASPVIAFLQITGDTDATWGFVTS